ncbi:MAG: nitroreductase family protein [Calditrichaeota bacterium]|nr:nitroreductase family protein [Calditrichota bacterium]
MSNLLISKVPVKYTQPIGDTYRFFRELLNIPLDYLFDSLKYAWFSSTFKATRSQRALQALIIRLYHGIEVGLTYENPRPGFGIKVVNRLVNYLGKYEKKYGFDTQAKIALNVLFQYYNFNKKNGIDNQPLFKKLNDLQKRIPVSLQEETRGGTLSIRKEDIEKTTNIDFESFVMSRHSIRQFASKPVDMDLIRKAVRMALRSPSACNRQQARVYVLDDPLVRDHVLTAQNGNRGWRDQPDKILLVTSNYEYYKESRERNGAYIDGSLFAMSLVWALHSVGLGSCCLNLNVTRNGVLKIKKATGIRPSEVLIMLIAVGHLPENLQVAASTRREVEEVLHVL